VDRGVVLDLLTAEGRLRRREQSAVTIAEYVERFPAFRDELLASATASLSPSGAARQPTSPYASTASLSSGLAPAGARTGEPAGPEVPSSGPAGDLATRSRYRVLRLHARGGLGEILAARDEELGREVALKRLQWHQARDAGSRGRFLREAELTSQLEH